MASNPRSITFGDCPDVTFVFKDNEEVLLADKCKLKHVSDVFRKQFSTNFGNNERIMIEDISYETFNKLLKFIYEKKIKITAQNYKDILYASKKYFIYSLMVEVIGFLENFIHVENIVDNIGLLDYDIQRLYDHFRSICIKNPVEIIKKLDASTKAHMDVLKMILESKSLNCSEYKLYVAVANMMERASIGADDVAAKMRKKLGNKLLHLIRFPVMPIDELVLCGKFPSLLTSQEILDIQLWVQEKIYSDTMLFLSTIPRNHTTFLEDGSKESSDDYEDYDYYENYYFYYDYIDYDSNYDSDDSDEY